MHLSGLRLLVLLIATVLPAQNFTPLDGLRGENIGIVDINPATGRASPWHLTKFLMTADIDYLRQNLPAMLQNAADSNVNWLLVDIWFAPWTPYYKHPLEVHPSTGVAGAADHVVFPRPRGNNPPAGQPVFESWYFEKLDFLFREIERRPEFEEVTVRYFFQGAMAGNCTRCTHQFSPDIYRQMRDAVRATTDYVESNLNGVRVTYDLAGELLAVSPGTVTLHPNIEAIATGLLADFGDRLCGRTMISLAYSGKPYLVDEAVRVIADAHLKGFLSPGCTPAIGFDIYQWSESRGTFVQPGDQLREGLGRLDALRGRYPWLVPEIGARVLETMSYEENQSSVETPRHIEGILDAVFDHRTTPVAGIATWPIRDATNGSVHSDYRALRSKFSFKNIYTDEESTGLIYFAGMGELFLYARGLHFGDPATINDQLLVRVYDDRNATAPVYTFRSWQGEVLGLSPNEPHAPDSVLVRLNGKLSAPLLQALARSWTGGGQALYAEVCTRAGNPAAPGGGGVMCSQRVLVKGRTVL